MIQDIEPLKLSNHYEPETLPSPSDPVFCFDRNEIAARITSSAEISSESSENAADSGQPEPKLRCEFPTVQDLLNFSEIHAETDLTFLFRIGGVPCFLLDISAIPARRPSHPEEASESAVHGGLTDRGFSFSTIRELRKDGALSPAQMYAAFTALHLVNWYRSSKFCGVCGTRTAKGSVERSMVCPRCGHIIYPRINPAVIVGVTNGDELLMTRYNRNRHVPYYALVAGFTEIGETFEQTVEREVMEETGLHVRNIRYFKSQPWGIADDILAGYYCDVDGDPAVHLDTSELSEAVWTKREDITGQPDDLSLTHHMMITFREGKEPR